MRLTTDEIKDRMVKRAGLSASEIKMSEVEIGEAGYRQDQFILIHKDAKSRLRWLGDMFAQIKWDGWDDGLRFEFGSLTAALSYLLNCSSFEDGKLYDFDKAEIDRKLMRKSQQTERGKNE